MRRVLVVGAGIGGLTAALALAGQGFQVDIAERSDELDEVGAGIQLSANAGRVLADLGLASAIADAAIEPSAIEVRNGLSGTLLSSISGSTLNARYDFPYWVIHRADLQRVLRQAVERSAAIKLHLGVEVGGGDASADHTGVRVRRPQLADATFAAVVAADGVRSSLRALVPGAATARAADRTAWRALVPVSAVGDLLPANAVCVWLGPRAHVVCYPVARGAAVNIVAIVEERSDQTGWGLPGAYPELARPLESWSPRVAQLLSLAESWKKYALMHVDPAGPWSADRLALLGDAAHAMMPFLAQGAAMAIEDAAVLAARLSAASDVPAALKLYEAERKGRVVRVAAAAARTGQRYHFTGGMAAARDLALRIAGERLILGEVDWIYRWRADAKSKFSGE